jgi:hypothetical protein
VFERIEKQEVLIKREGGYGTCLGMHSFDF